MFPSKHRFFLVTGLVLILLTVGISATSPLDASANLFSEAKVFLGLESSVSVLPTPRTRKFREGADLVTAAYAPLATSYTWVSSVTSTAWLTTANWNGNTGHYPGLPITSSSSQGASDDVASIGAVSFSGNTIGINMTTTGGGLALGAIDLNSSKPIILGDSTTTSGVLTLNGGTLNSTSNVILANESSSLLTLQNNGGSTGLMGIALGNPTENIIQVNGSVRMPDDKL